MKKVFIYYSLTGNGDEVSKVFDEICQKKFNLGLLDLIQDIDLSDDEIEKFSQELTEALLGKTPRGK